MGQYSTRNDNNDNGAARHRTRMARSGAYNNDYPLVKKSDYIEFITKEFMSKYHGDSFTSFYSTYYDVRMISDEALDAFVAWVKRRRSEFRRYHSDN